MQLLGADREDCMERYITKRAAKIITAGDIVIKFLGENLVGLPLG